MRDFSHIVFWGWPFILLFLIDGIDGFFLFLIALNAVLLLRLAVLKRFWLTLGLMFKMIGWNVVLLRRGWFVFIDCFGNGFLMCL